LSAAVGGFDSDQASTANIDDPNDGPSHSPPSDPGDDNTICPIGVTAAMFWNAWVWEKSIEHQGRQVLA